MTKPNFSWTLIWETFFFPPPEFNSWYNNSKKEVVKIPYFLTVPFADDHEVAAQDSSHENLAQPGVSAASSARAPALRSLFD